MKKLFKVLGIILLVIVGLLAILLLLLSTAKSVPGNYTKNVQTGGELEARYLAEGPYAVKHVKIKAEEPLQQIEIWYPEALAERDETWPVVVFANGTGIPAKQYPALFRHLASWGFIAIGNEDPSSGNGLSSDRTLMYLLEENETPSSVFYQKLDTGNIGITGHSQGGAGVFSASTINEHSELFKTAVALSPTHEETAHGLGWMYELEKIQIPVMMLAGTEGEFETQLVLPIDAMNTMYDKIPAPKLMMRRIGAEHGQMLYMADGYVTAWFLWQLQGDEEAARAFTGSAPEVLSNALYQDQRNDLG